MKTLPTGMQTHLDSHFTTLCWCWKVTRKDGVVLGFTNHDVPVTFNGLTYEASTSFTISELQGTLGLAIDNVDATSALMSESLTEEDISAGLYDRAAIEIWRVNWADTTMAVQMRGGWFGEIQRGKTFFTVTLVGLADALNQSVGRAMNSLCDADLGDSNCSPNGEIDLTDPTYLGTGHVITVSDSTHFIVGGINSFDDQWFTGGKLTWTSGANEGQVVQVKRHTLAGSVCLVEIWTEMSEPVSTGDNFNITAGCNKIFGGTDGDCKNKFANTDNNQSFPYITGNDLLASYPTADQTMDGGSRYGNTGGDSNGSGPLDRVGPITTLIHFTYSTGGEWTWDSIINASSYVIIVQGKGLTGNWETLRNPEQVDHTFTYSAADAASDGFSLPFGLFLRIGVKAKNVDGESPSYTFSSVDS